MGFNQWISSIADAGMELINRGRSQDKGDTIEQLCAQLTTSKGEALGTAIAHQVVNAYCSLDGAGKLEFFKHLKATYSADRQAILRCADAYRLSDDSSTFQALSTAVDGPLKGLLRAINMSPKGTATLVAMRQDLLALIKDNPELKSLDNDFLYLMRSWFNRGFLKLRSINWQTPAHILEKLIAYEAVHEMQGWEDLRRRLASDRRCFAFFHPALPDEPLIFVQVALVEGMSASVQAVLAKPEDEQSNDGFDTAIFYSISNCQKGLLGISFGNFLIKQVVMELQKEFSQLKNFATLSPIPGFCRWLKKEVEDHRSTVISDEDRKLLQVMQADNWHENKDASHLLKPVLMRICSHYLVNVKRGDLPLDPVARFHLGNGAQVARINWLGDTSKNGLKQSAGMLVNYGYQLDKVEENHESFVNDHQVIFSKSVEKLLPVD